MVDLPRAARDLVQAATSQTEPRDLKRAVSAMLGAFDKVSESVRKAGVRTIAQALPTVDGRGAQILCLALGALVEGGAPPELVWPAVADDLQGLLDRATSFATAAVKQAKDHHLDAAIEAAGSVVAKKMPAEATAWNALPSRCLTAVACLTRSKKIRDRVRGNTALEEAAWPLSDAVAGVGDLLQALRIVDDETFLVLVPELGRGWRVAVDELASNAELYVLLADAIVGDVKQGRLPGKRPDKRAIAAIKGGTNPPAAAASVVTPFQLVAWTATTEDGSLPPASDDEGDHLIWMEGLPADIPRHGDVPIVLLQAPPYPRPVPVVPSFDSLRPDVKIVAELSPVEVERTMLKLGRAAAKLRASAHEHDHDHDHDHAPPKSPKKAKAGAKKKAKAGAKEKAKKSAKKASRRAQ